MRTPSRLKHVNLETLKRKVNEVKEDPRMLRIVLKELFLTFKKPLLFLLLIGFIVLILVPPLTYVWFVRDLSSKEKIINRKNAGVILYDRNNKPFFTLYGGRTRETVPLSDIPKTMQDAVVASEDHDFYKHPGFSLEGIGRAVLSNFKEERLAQGGSTISQQLVKNTLLTQDKNFLRKYQEIFLALEIERRFSKQDILEMYLNTVYFGEGAFGVQEAAETYFGEDSQDLTLAQSSLLSAILPAPSALSPITGNRERAYERQKIVLGLMQAQGFITEAQKEQAENQTISFNEQDEDVTIQAPHFALMVKEELIKKYGEQQVANSGYQVKTTIDLDWQDYAESTVQDQVARLASSDVTNGAAVVLNPKNGEIMALVGSHDWFDDTNGKINMAVRPRQPGSSFKPIVYAKALDERLITPATELDDKAITFPGGYKPMNYDNKFRDHVLARFALANSLNIPAIHVQEKVGVPETLEFAKKLGITTLNANQDYGLALVLGAGEVPLTQMTQTYGVFANQGVLTESTTILEIKDKNNKTIYTHRPDKKTVLSDDVAFLISSILSDNGARAETFGGALTISRQAAVKTGTTNDYKDALTIGYTPSLVVGVWLGNNDNKPMSRIAGSLGAAPIWRLLMERFLRNTPVERFARPLGVVTENICREKGLKSTIATSSAYTEYFLTGTLPTKDCYGTDLTGTPTPTPQPSETPAPSATPTNVPEQPTSTPVPTTQPVVDTPTPTSPIIVVPTL